jgi:hypothetical protein
MEEDDEFLYGGKPEAAEEVKPKTVEEVKPDATK